MRNGNYHILQKVHLQAHLVLTVPMRNGNLIHAVVVVGQNLVLTVPMRNGNNYETFGAGMVLLEFLPYL